jgi:hypothetical protein
MQKFKVSVTVSFIILVLTIAYLTFNILYSSNEKEEDLSQDSSNSKVEFQSYLEIIRELESEIVKLREEQYTSSIEYAKEISSLENKLSELYESIELLSGEEKIPFTYHIEKDEIIIDGYTGSQKEVIIPSEIDGIPVRIIGERAFYGMSISSVKIPDGVRELSWFAFYNCFDLHDIYIPASVNSIGYAAFDGCPRKELTLHCTESSYAKLYAESYGLSYSLE